MLFLAHFQKYRSQDTICSPLHNVPIVNKSFPEISNLKLANPMILQQQELSIDALVRGDFFGDFMTGNVFKTSFGTMAVNTPLGIILSGNCNSTDLKSNYHAQFS